MRKKPIPWFQFWSNLWRSRGDRFSNLKTEIRAWFVKEQPISCLPKPYLKNYDVKNQDANTRAQASSTQNYHKGTYLKSIIEGRYSDSIIAYSCNGICTNTKNDSCTEIRFSTLVYYFYKKGEKILYDKDNHNNPVDYNPIKMESYKYTLPENSDLYFRNLYNNISQIPSGAYQEEKDIAGVSSRELNHSLRTFLPASSQSPTPVRSVFTQKGIEDMIDDNDIQQQTVFSNLIPYQNLIGVIGRYSKSKTLGETDETNPTVEIDDQIGEDSDCLNEDNRPIDCHCAGSSQCASGLCKDGRCTATDECASVSQRPLNCQCSTNFQCASKSCSTSGKCAPPPDCNSNSNRPIDCHCAGSSQCASGLCKDGRCTVTKFDTLREMFKDNLHPYTWQYDLDGLPEREDDTGLCTAKSSHCHGLSQFGALGMALAGSNYETILRSYYGNIRLVNLRDIAGPNHLYIEVSNENCDACVKLKPNGNCDTKATSRMYIEDYLRGLGEIPDSWGSTKMGGMAAIEAQVIAARTYAYVRTLGFSRPICTTAACPSFSL